MKKILFFFLFSILLISFASAMDCDITKFNEDENFDVRRDSSITIRADDDEKIIYKISEGDICFLGSGHPTSSDCSRDDFDSWRRGTIDPDERETFSLDSCRCYEVELEHRDCVECRDGREDCDDYEFLECEDGEWESQGEIEGECDVECFDGETECRGTKLYECDEFEWDSLGEVTGECGVECVSTGDCSSGQLCQNSQCVQDPCKFVECDDFCSNGVRNSEGFCSNGQCNYKTVNCEFGCSGDFCTDDPCLGVDTSDRCENGRWFQDGSCSNGEVNFAKTDTCAFGCQGEPVGVLALVSEGGLCRSSPCEGVNCKDYCSGTNLFTGGSCDNGKCVYSDEREYSEDCGYIPFFQRTSTQIILSVLVIILILVAVAIINKKRKRG